jgi:hypothetical protein
MPFFDGRLPTDLVAAAPFDYRVNVPWYLVGANAFDVQHFRTAHDRKLIDEPVVDSPAPFARRIVARYEVSGDSWRDRITRAWSGEQCTLSAIVWGGPLVLVTAQFRRTTSYGMVTIQPLAEAKSLARILVWVPRRTHAGGRIINVLDAAVRRAFIRAFLRPDVTAADGIRYTPGTLIDADRELASYMQWLSDTSQLGIER